LLWANLLKGEMFNQNTSSDTKIAVLEERLSSFEIMMKKIDEAIQIMGKTSQNISKMLAVHEEKIEHSNKTDEMITKMINELKEENKEQHKTVSEKIQSLESKVEELGKYRWIIAGAAIILSFVISQSHMVVDILTPDQRPVKVETTKQ
jgi:transcription initiation factor TFIIIB Brf1 subunit/transcription initiation factor TFIIB